MPLPSFEDIRREVHRMLGDAEQMLRSDFAHGSGPVGGQLDALDDVLKHIRDARTDLDRAAQPR